MILEIKFKIPNYHRVICYHRFSLEHHRDDYLVVRKFLSGFNPSSTCYRVVAKWIKRHMKSTRDNRTIGVESRMYKRTVGEYPILVKFRFDCIGHSEPALQSSR